MARHLALPILIILAGTAWLLNVLDIIPGVLLLLARLLRLPVPRASEPDEGQKE